MHSRLTDALREACRILDCAQVKYALAGALAVGTWTEPRFTSDIDLALAVSSDSHAEEIVRFMVQNGYGVRQVFQHKETKRILTVRLYQDSQPDLLTDLLFTTSGIEDLVVKQAVPIQVFSGQVIPVASIGHLIAMKLLSQSDERPNDKADLNALLLEATPTDLKQAKEAVQTMDTRKAGKGRSLVQEFEELLLKKESPNRQKKTDSAGS